MSHGRTLCLCMALLTLGSAGKVSAQEPTVIEGLSIADTLVTLVSPAGSFAVGDALRAAALVDIATTPLGNASPGFTFVFDSELGLDVRRTSTFGSAFAERASTLGAGMFTAGSSVLVASYDKVGDTGLDRVLLSDVETGSPFLPKSATASLVLSSTTMALFGSMGLTDRLDVGVAVPFVEVGVEGVSWVESNDPDEDFQAARPLHGGRERSRPG